MPSHTATSTASAKINLGLEVLQKRTDGYHEIVTVFCPVSLSDEITCTRTRSGLTLDVHGLTVPADETNLCMKAAELLLPHAEVPCGAEIHLTKRIPIGAGLGGGSSDAACVLAMLNELWNAHCSPEQLKELAIQLGADVPYFLKGGLALARGIGEVLQPVDTSFPFWIVIVVPPEKVSTAWAYKHVRPRNTKESRLFDAFLESAEDLSMLDQLLVNDFEPVVMPRYPKVKEAARILAREGLACVRMSGSGSAVFGLTRSETAARSAVSAFRAPYEAFFSPPFSL